MHAERPEVIVRTTSAQEPLLAVQLDLFFSAFRDLGPAITDKVLGVFRLLVRSSSKKCATRLSADRVGSRGGAKSSEAETELRPGEWRSRCQVLYWMNRAHRDLVVQTPFSTMHTIGTFALRSPVRPNPGASSIVELMAIDGTTLQVRGLDSLDGKPLIDLKPECGTRSSGRITGKPRRRDQFRGAVEATSTGVAR